MSWLAPPPLPRTWEASVRDLDAKKSEVRVSAVVDLTKHATRDDAARTKAIPLLERRLADEAPQVRAIAAVSLGDVAAHEALPRLLVTIDDEHPHVRQMAINALGEIGDARAASRLSRALTDERPEVRYQATIAFSRVAEDPADVEAALLRATGDADDAVRYIALRLAEERATKAHGRASAAMAKAAKDHLSDPSAAVGLASAILLANVGPGEHDARIKPLLLAVALGEQRPKPDPEDEAEAIEIAGRMNLREAIPVLERRAFGLFRLVRDTSSFAARVALARMGHARATAEILRDLASADGEKRSAAIVAAGRAHLREAKPMLERMGGLGAPGTTEAEATLASEALALLGQMDKAAS